MEEEAAVPVPLPLPRGAIDHVFSFLYEELLQIARAVHRRDPSFATTTTALVNESWLRLRDSPQLSGISNHHFKAIAVKVMRRILSTPPGNVMQKSAARVVPLWTSNQFNSSFKLHRRTFNFWRSIPPSINWNV